MKNNLQQPWNMYIDRAWFKHQSSNFQRVSSLVCSYRNVKLLLVYSSIDLFYPFLFVYMLNFPLFLLVKRKRKLRATRVLASNNPINIMLHYTSAAISNRYCVTVPLAILILFLFINPYTLPSSFIVSFTIREIPQFFWQKRWWPSTYHDWLFVDEKPTQPSLPLSLPESPWLPFQSSQIQAPQPPSQLLLDLLTCLKSSSVSIPKLLSPKLGCPWRTPNLPPGPPWCIFMFSSWSFLFHLGLFGGDHPR